MSVLAGPMTCSHSECTCLSYDMISLCVSGEGEWTVGGEAVDTAGGRAGRGLHPRACTSGRALVPRSM